VVTKQTALFVRMDQGTTEEFEHIVERANEHLHTHLVDNVFGLLRSMQGDTLGYCIDRYEHSLQSATRALREEARIDMIVAALLHDVGDTIAPGDLTFLDQSGLSRPTGADTIPQTSERRTLHEARDQFERDLILRTLAEQQGNMSRTAEVLGVERSNLYRKMKAFGIAPSRRPEGEEETV